MPELPEVETVARKLRGALVGWRIVRARTKWPRHIDRPSLDQFKRRIEGRAVHSVGRRGKYVVIGLDHDEHLLVHLKMSGQLLVLKGEDPVNKHDHTIFTLEDGRELRFRDTRKFGRIYLVRDKSEVLGKLGPEPLSADFTRELFQTMLRSRKRIIKPLLLDQTFVAGIGNIYADEALHRAAIDPRRISDTITNDESVSLHSGIQGALMAGILRGGASVDDYRKPDGSKGSMQQALLVYGRSGEPCQRCHETIVRIVLGGRSTHFCPGCQR